MKAIFLPDYTERSVPASLIEEIHAVFDKHSAAMAIDIGAAEVAVDKTKAPLISVCKDGLYIILPAKAKCTSPRCPHDHDKFLGAAISEGQLSETSRQLLGDTLEQGRAVARMSIFTPEGVTEEQYPMPSMREVAFFIEGYLGPFLHNILFGGPRERRALDEIKEFVDMLTKLPPSKEAEEGPPERPAN